MYLYMRLAVWLSYGVNDTVNPFELHNVTYHIIKAVTPHGIDKATDMHFIQSHLSGSHRLPKSCGGLVRICAALGHAR